jgi:hypothetical protein
MFQITEQHLKKIEAINAVLEFQHGVRIHAADLNHFQTMMEHYKQRRGMLIETMGFDQAIQTSEYKKAYLICEAARIVLREIAPRRTKKSRSK